MRISDWSSDVCSSDLKLDEACQTALHRDRVARLFFGRKAPDGHIHGIRRNRLGAANRQGDVIVDHQIGEEHQVSVPVSDAEGAFLAEAADQIRSEEGRVGKEWVYV